MRKLFRLTGAITFICLAISAGFATAQSSQKAAPGTIVIVFKDGHRQSYKLADIDRVEFGAASGYASSGDSSSPGQPSRGRFLGKWECGDGSGGTFYITLNEDGSAWRSLRSVGGHWSYVDGEARVTWNDGAQDAIRKVGSQYQKFAYAAGKLFTDDPDNVTSARNTTPHPI
jgi:hypothetical protein